MGYLNHNFRFNSEKDEDTRAWEILHSEVVKDNFKSQNTFVIKAINEYYDNRFLKLLKIRCLQSGRKRTGLQSG